MNKSDDHTVFLRNVSFGTNGRFKCVISAEGTFQTLENAKDIEVIGNLKIAHYLYVPIVTPFFICVHLLCQLSL